MKHPGLGSADVDDNFSGHPSPISIRDQNSSNSLLWKVRSKALDTLLPQPGTDDRGKFEAAATVARVTVLSLISV